MSITYEQKASAALTQLKLTTAMAQLDSAAQHAAAAGWSYAHFLGYLLEAELLERQRRTGRLNLQFARFPYHSRLEDFDYTAQPTVGVVDSSRMGKVVALDLLLKRYGFLRSYSCRTDTVVVAGLIKRFVLS